MSGAPALGRQRQENRWGLLIIQSSELREFLSSKKFDEE